MTTGTQRLMMMWPLDPDTSRSEAVTEAQEQILELLGDKGLCLLSGHYTVVAPDQSAGGWLLAFDGLAEAVTVGEGSVVEPWLPLDIVIRDGCGDFGQGGRGKWPAERAEAGRRVLLAQGEGRSAQDIADMAGVSKRTVQRLAAFAGGAA